MTPAIEAALKRAHTRLGNETRADIPMLSHIVYIVLEELGLDRNISVLSMPLACNHEGQKVYERYDASSYLVRPYAGGHELAQHWICRCCGAEGADPIRGSQADPYESERLVHQKKLRAADEEEQTATPIKSVVDKPEPESLHHKQFTKSLSIHYLDLSTKELDQIRAVVESVPGCRLLVNREEAT